MGSMDRCADCGFDYSVTTTQTARRMIRDSSEDIATMVAGAGDSVARRSDPDVWSPLEYGCHVRDVLLVQRERILLALVEDTPSFVPMYRDRRVDDARYGAELPAAVAAHLAMASSLLLWVFEGLTAEQLDRPCVYNYPEPTQRIVEWLLVHTAHEVVHHAADVRRELGR